MDYADGCHRDSDKQAVTFGDGKGAICHSRPLPENIYNVEQAQFAATGGFLEENAAVEPPSRGLKRETVKEAQMNQKSLFTLGCLTIVLALALAACGGPEKVTLQVELQDFSFTPATYTVPAAGEVEITLANNGTVKHEWVLFEQGYQLAPGESFTDEAEGHIYWEAEIEEPGASQTFTFTAPDEPGVYQVVCGVEGHFEQGMAGTLTVEP